MALAAVALAGCETTLPSEMSHTEAKQLAMEIIQRCVDQGVKPGSAEMEVCTNHETHREVGKRLANRQTVRDVAHGLGSAAESYSEASQRRSVTCTSTLMGPAVRTTCF